MELKSSKRYFLVKCIAYRNVDSPSFMNNNLNFLCLLPSFLFPHRTNETNTKLQKTLKKQNKRRVQHTQQMKPRPNNKKREKKFKTKENENNIAWACSNSTKQNVQIRTKKKLQTSPLHIISPAMCCPLLKGKNSQLNKLNIHTISNVKHISKPIIIQNRKHNSPRVCFITMDTVCIPLACAHQKNPSIEDTQ